MSYESTMRAMQTTNSRALSKWIWRHLCIHGRVYIPWEWSMPCYSKIGCLAKSEQTAAIERFNLRNQNATVGY